MTSAGNHPIGGSSAAPAAEASARRPPFQQLRLVLLLWLIYLLIGPTIGFQWIDSWHNEQRAVQIVLLVLTALAWYATLVLRPAVAHQDLGYPPLALLFLGLGLVSTSLAGFQISAFAEVGMVALLIMLALFTAQAASEDFDRYLRWAQWFSLLFTTAYVLGVATRYLAAVNLGRPIDLDVFILGYANPRFASALHALLIPFIAAFIATRSTKPWLRFGAFAILSLIWAINLGLGTRAIWLAFALGLPLTAFVVGIRAVSRTALAIVAAAACGVALNFLLFHFAPTAAGAGSALLAPTNNTTLTSRDVIWRMSWDAITSAPWVGIGPMQFAALGSEVGAHPHNWVFQIAAEWGIPALLVCFLGLATLFTKVRIAARSECGVVAPTLAITVALAYGLVDGNLVMPISQSATALVFGLLLAGLEVKKPDPQASARRMPSWFGPWAAILSCAVVVAFATNTLEAQGMKSLDFKKAHPGVWLVPRFWEQGLLLP